MHRYDEPANYCMVYAGERGPWCSWIQALSKNGKTSREKCYEGTSKNKRFVVLLQT